LSRSFIKLVKEKIAQAIMQKRVFIEFKCLGLVCLAAADNHGTCVSGFMKILY
jgi:hypothetical protein